jgi:hypothetical protein
MRLIGIRRKWNICSHFQFKEVWISSCGAIEVGSEGWEIMVGGLISLKGAG